MSAGDWEAEQTRLAEVCRKAVERFAQKTPEERVAFLVERGLIDKHGNVIS